MKPAPSEAMPVHNDVPFDDIEVENITPIYSQTKLQYITPIQDHVVSL